MTVGDTPAAAARSLVEKIRAFLLDPKDETKRQETHLALLRYESISLITDNRQPRRLSSNESDF